LTLFVGSFDPLKLVSDMTFHVFGWTLNLNQLHLQPVQDSDRFISWPVGVKRPTLDFNFITFCLC